jgi:hypothetical protein
MMTLRVSLLACALTTALFACGETDTHRDTTPAQINHEPMTGETAKPIETTEPSLPDMIKAGKSGPSLGGEQTEAGTAGTLGTIPDRSNADGQGARTKPAETSTEDIDRNR